MSTYDSIVAAGGDTAAPLSLEKRLRILAPYLKQGTRFLDCGCGCGNYVKIIRHRFNVDATGVEYLEEKVARARQDTSIARWIIQGDLANLHYPANHFDAALLNEVIEHVPDEKRSLREIARVLKPGGILVVFAPNRLYPFETHGVHSKKGKKALPVYIPGIPYVPVAIGRRFWDYWARNYWPWELSSLAGQCGFEIVRRTAIWQTFENISNEQPAMIRHLRPLLRGLANILEKTPIVRHLGVSQVLVLRKGSCLAQED